MPAFADTYGQGASTPVILYVDGENEEIEEREYSMDVDDTFDVRPSNQYQPQSQQKGYNKVVDDMMSIDVEKVGFKFINQFIIFNMIDIDHPKRYPCYRFKYFNS